MVGHLVWSEKQILIGDSIKFGQLMMVVGDVRIVVRERKVDINRKADLNES